MGDLDITPWLLRFPAYLRHAFDGVGNVLADARRKPRAWEVHGRAPLNERQRDMLNRLLDGFEGKLTSSK
ncbi:MAG: hypothetical protein ACJ8DV_19995 [Microvirga sp.]|jgi:hypothetical protein